MRQLSEQKTELRSRLRRQREDMDREALARDSAALCERLLALPELQKARTVFCYVSRDGEVDTHGLIGRLLEQGKTAAVPRCKGGGLMDCVPITSLSRLKAGAMGILEPDSHAASIPPERVEFAVVPAMACGEDGSRLGQGGGYYDRFLTRARCPFAAVCLEEFLFPALPCEPHDCFMKIIVTQRRVLRFEEV